MRATCWRPTQHRVPPGRGQALRQLPANPAFHPGFIAPDFLLRGRRILPTYDESFATLRLRPVQTAHEVWDDYMARSRSAPLAAVNPKSANAVAGPAHQHRAHRWVSLFRRYRKRHGTNRLPASL